MTRCKSFRDMLLTADISELRGDVDTPLTRHLATCEGCAAAARRVVEETEWLGRALARRTPELDVDAILSRAEGEARGDGSPVELPSHPSRRRLARARRPWVALAVAAGVAALVLLAREDGRGPRTAPPGVGTSPALSNQALPTVEAAPGHDVAVIPTDNPDVTVVWYF